MEEKYEVLRLRGEGAQGRVLLCKERATGTLLACKTSLAHCNAVSKTSKLWRKLFGVGHRKEDMDHDQRAQDDELRHKIQVMGRALHPDAHGLHPRYILPVHSTFQSDDGFLHLVTPFCEEGNLSDKLHAGRHVSSKPTPLLSKRQAAKVIASLARALAHCHLRGVVHLDVKLENVLLHHHALVEDAHGTDESVEDLDVLLADFGVGTYLSPGHTLSTLVGTPKYMAPEVQRGYYDQRADIWSLSIVLHVLLSGAFLPPNSKPHISIRLDDTNAHYKR